MSWLCGVEIFSAELRRVNELESSVRHPETEREQMARVLREQAKHVMWLEVRSPTFRDGRQFLSDDAREIIEESSVASNDSPEE